MDKLPASVMYCGRGHLGDIGFAADSEDRDEAGKEADGGDDGAADGNSLGLGLGRVAHGIKVGQDLAGALVVLLAHFLRS